MKVKADDADAACMPMSLGPITYQTGSLKEGSVSFDVGIESLPYLIDHGFQDMTVLPGSFYIELALRIHIESLNALVGNIKRVEFQNPVILSEQNVPLLVEMKWPNDQTVQYTFREVSGANSNSAAGSTCAVLEIECGCQRQPDANAAVLSVEAFQQRAVYLGDQASFYHRLRENGNQYGPHFQNLHHIWRAGEESLGRLHVSQNAFGTKRHHLDPIFMDGVTQLLSAFFLDQGRTFILQGAEAITLLQPDFPDTVWVHARLRPKDNPNIVGRVGDLDVFDDSGAHCLRLQSVRFTYLDRPEKRESVEVSKTKIVIASTFTAEPVEDSLKFWGDYLEFPVQVSFAPYSQVFQELLNPSSQLRRNQDGINVILLNLADWSANGRLIDLKMDLEKAAVCFGGLERHILPNGLEVAHLNRHETEYVYKEIFEDQCYLRHGIHLPDNATVIDIGANIGLFSLFVRAHCPQASIYAFEPSPVAFQVLKANCEVYGPHLHPFNVGISERRGSAPLTFYNKSSVFSGFHPSADEDRQAIKAVVANMVRSELGNTAESVDEYVGELMTDRLNRQMFECPLISVSDVIHENSLQRVNLLKVDAEKCELEILRGIEENHWPLIDQVVVEVHDRSRRTLEEVQVLLTKRGFRCAVEEENLLAGSGLFNVYATKHENGVEQSVTKSPIADTQSKIDQFVQAMGAFTRTNKTPTVLCLCPPRRKNSSPVTFDQDLAASEKYLLKQVRELQNVHIIGSETILAHYQTNTFHDPHTNNLGHIPYTPEGFAAIGTSLFRTFIGLRRVPYKMIVLDCDNTLWQGVCGEEGPLGVTVTPAHRALQEFMIRQMAAGMLICLCSKNSEEDVWAVFAQNPGMVLKRDHLAAWRINWHPKSENLKSLTRELNLGLESIIFVDDNPVECAEVRAQCPAILTLQLPSDANHLPRFLDHVWAFDHLLITEEDRTRTQKILENVQREKYRDQVSTLKDFIDGLKLQVTLFEPASDQISRVSQLTLRTNQFNFTTIRRLESDIIDFLENETGHCLVAKVSDRFGDYGMVGLLFYRENGDCYDVDTFLLSCRVLGRGVEHQILAQFGRLALNRGKQSINFLFRPTEKNQPAWEFIQSVGAEFMCKVDDGLTFQLPAARLAGLRYNPDLPKTSQKPTEDNNSNNRSTLAVAGLTEKFQRIANEFNGVKEIYAAIEAHRLRANGNGEAPGGDELLATLAGKMLRIWRKVIGNPRIGMNDNFIDAGGTSLRAVQIVAAIRRELHLHLSIVNIFECPTVQLLCDKLELEKAAGGSAGEAVERGARRRKQRVRRLV
jgi:FkbH-like protein/FkbM family methyltransferase